MKLLGMRALLLCAVIAGTRGGAHANGAFPAPLAVLTESGGGLIAVATNFGLVSSEDAGRTWAWSCEHGVATGITSYAVMQGPRSTTDRIYALTPNHLVFTEDLGCTWGEALLPSGVRPVDVFVDRADSRIYLVGAKNGQGGPESFVWSSADGAKTFQPLAIQVPATAAFVSVESVGSGQTIYVTLFDGYQGNTLVRTEDGGRTFQRHIIDLPGAEQRRARIIAVDPMRPAHVWLRLEGARSDDIVWSNDGGRTLRHYPSNSVIFSGGVLLDSGALALVGRDMGKDSPGGVFWLISESGAITYQGHTPVPLVGLGRRNQHLLAIPAGLNNGDTLMASVDTGRTWERFLSVNEVTRARPCLSGTSVCAQSCGMTAALGYLSPLVCRVQPTVVGSDSDSTVPPPVVPLAVAMPASPNAAPMQGRSAGCSACPGGNPNVWATLLVASLLGAWRLFRSRRPHRLTESLVQERHRLPGNTA